MFQICGRVHFRLSVLKSEPVYSFQIHTDLIPMAMRNLDAFNTWFRTHFDVYLHAETNTMIDDAALILESVHHFLLMRPPPEDPVANVPDSTSTGGPEIATSTHDAEP